jgi:hypothetical protein
MGQEPAMQIEVDGVVMPSAMVARHGLEPFDQSLPGSRPHEINRDA